MYVCIYLSMYVCKLHAYINLLMKVGIYLCNMYVWRYLCMYVGSSADNKKEDLHLPLLKSHVLTVKTHFSRNSCVIWRRGKNTRDFRQLLCVTHTRMCCMIVLSFSKRVKHFLLNRKRIRVSIWMCQTRKNTYNGWFLKKNSD